jgi:hypothetical protein
MIKKLAHAKNKSEITGWKNVLYLLKKIQIQICITW